MRSEEMVKELGNRSEECTRLNTAEWFVVVAQGSLMSTRRRHKRGC